ncbi:putative permease [Methanocalculus alkaliphilus]|uniref:AEC family transporter n=1 Tax=Methanocalculus alkaliphilus TaxID=768730 RepID=UPI00209E3BDD|nr:AEC family transporter [Methanocalculus alkaliphilus]MCP1715946.1 putative permease [Methanocalculus alkaliphilus]
MTLSAAGILMVADRITILLILIAVGYLAFRLGILDRQATHKLSLLLLHVTIPALIIVSMQIPASPELLSGAVVFCLAIGVFYLLAATVAYCGTVLLRMEDRERGVFSFAILFGNVGFMGFPIAEALFGAASLFYVALGNLVFNLLVFSAGIVMMTGRYDFNPRLLINPGIAASYIGLTLFLLGLRIPSPLFDAMEITGNLTTPLAMIIVGSLLATFPAKEMIGDLKAYLATVLRLIVLPIATYLLLAPLIADPLVLGVLVILAAMPVASTTAIFAEIYGGDERFASRLVFVSMIFSIISIPLIGAFLI